VLRHHHRREIVLNGVLYDLFSDSLVEDDSCMMGSQPVVQVVYSSSPAVKHDSPSQFP
jgi:hypothetical protein